MFLCHLANVVVEVLKQLFRKIMQYGPVVDRMVLPAEDSQGIRDS